MCLKNRQADLRRFLLLPLGLMHLPEESKDITLL